MISSLPPEPITHVDTLRVLTFVDDLSPDATGVLRFGDAGTILVESRLICWAVAGGMEQRLTDLLRHQRNPPLDRGFLEVTVRDCRASGAPLGQALLASGQITEQGLRTALFRQAVQAIAHIARDAEDAPPEFVRRESSRYDARFSFSSAEIYAALGARHDRALAAVARRHLDGVLVPGTTGVASLACDPRTVISAVNGARLRLEALCEACAWSAGLLSVVGEVRPGAALAMATWYAGEPRLPAASVVAWRTNGLQLTAIADTRASAAVLAQRVLASVSGGGS